MSNVDAQPAIVWKTHPVHVNYAASSDGRVRNVTTGNELSLFVIGLGYRGFDIRKRKTPVHRFVAECFLGPAPTSEHQVRHLNGNPADNRVVNLAWGTAAENSQDRIAHGRQYRRGTVRRGTATACPEGHDFDEVNTAYSPTGRRRCRACERRRGRARYRKMKERVNA